MVRFVSILLLYFTTTLSSFAVCEKPYKDFLRLNIETAMTSPLSSSSQVSSAFVTSLQGTLQGLTLTDTNITIGKVIIGGVVLVDTYFSFEDVLYDLKAFGSRVEALKLIEESQVGFGINLDQLTDELREQYGDGEFPYTTKEIATFIQEADKARVFCPKKGRVFTRHKMLDYLKEKLAI